MAFMGCVGSHSHDARLQATEEAVKENAIGRLQSLLADGSITAEELDRKHLLHQAAWMGYDKCAKVLLEHGASPDVPHKKNGCTPLHLAHFCQVEDTNPAHTINALVAAGGNVNSSGDVKCGKYPVDHAIQHQRLDSVQALIKAGSLVTLQSVLISIDVANPQILELLLLSGGDCGKMLESTLFWGQPLHRLLYTPLKCPRECYKQQFRILVQASVCYPIITLSADMEPSKKPSNVHLMIETEMRTSARDYTDLTLYLYATLLRNGFFPTEPIKLFMSTIGHIDWEEDYLNSTLPLRELCIRLIRSRVYLSGNIIHGTNKLSIPNRLKDLIIMSNPF